MIFNHIFNRIGIENNKMFFKKCKLIVNMIIITWTYIFCLYCSYFIDSYLFMYNFNIFFNINYDLITILSCFLIFYRFLFVDVKVWYIFEHQLWPYNHTFFVFWRMFIRKWEAPTNSTNIKPPRNIMIA